MVYHGQSGPEKQVYNEAKVVAKIAFFKAKHSERKTFLEDLDGEDGKGNVVR